MAHLVEEMQLKQQCTVLVPVHGVALVVVCGLESDTSTCKVLHGQWHAYLVVKANSLVSVNCPHKLSAQKISLSQSGINLEASCVKG